MRSRSAAVVLFALTAVPAHADGLQVAKCRAQPGLASCHLVFAKIAGVSVLAEPDAAATKTAELERAQPVQIDWRATLAAPPDWVHVDTVGRPGPRNGSPKGWIRSADLVGDADFRRVDACWPFKSLVDLEVVDGSPVNLKFTPHGVGADGHVRVWRAGEVIRIGTSLSAATPYAYDEPGRRLYDPVMHRFPEVTVFDFKDMRDCASAGSERK